MPGLQKPKAALEFTDPKERADFIASALDKVMRANISNVVEQKGFALEEAEEVEVEGADRASSGVAFKEKPSERLFMLACVRGDRLYLVGVQFPQNDEAALDAAAKFMASFRLAPPAP